MGNPWNFTEDHMKEIFNSMDANGDGKVSFDELIKAYCVKKWEQYELFWKRLMLTVNYSQVGFKF